MLRQYRGGDYIGRMLLIEFNDRDDSVFDEIMEMLKVHPMVEHLHFEDEPILSLSNLKIYPRRRKAYIDSLELELMAKEFDILYLLAVNKGYVLTYNQIYEKIWGGDSISDENNSVGCHIRSLRRKLFKEYPDAPFTIRCHRNIGYCLEIDSK